MLWRTLQTPSFSKMGLLYNFRPKWSFFFNEFPFPSNSIFSWDFCLKWLIIWVVFWSQDLLVCLLLRLQTVLEAFRTSCFFSISGKVMLVRRGWWEDSLLQHWFDPFFISCLQLNLEEAKMHKPTKTTRVETRITQQMSAISITLSSFHSEFSRGMLLMQTFRIYERYKILDVKHISRIVEI